MKANDVYNQKYPVKCLVCEGEGILAYPPRVIGARGPGDRVFEHPQAGTLVCDWCEGTGEMKD